MAIVFNGSKVKQIKYNGNYVTSLKNSDGTYMWAAEQKIVEDYCECEPGTVYNSRTSSLEPTANLWEKNYRYLDEATCYVGDQISFGTEKEAPAGYAWIYGNVDFVIKHYPDGADYLIPEIWSETYPDNLEEIMVLDSYEMDPNTSMGNPRYRTYWRIYNPNDYDITCSYQDYFINWNGLEVCYSTGATLDILAKSWCPSHIETCSFSTAGRCVGLKIVLTDIRAADGTGCRVPELVFKTEGYDELISESSTTTA